MYVIKNHIKDAFYIFGNIKRSVFQGISKKFLVCSAFVKMFTPGYKPVTSWSLTVHILCTDVTKIIYAPTIGNTTKKSLSRDKLWSVFISGGNICVRIRALHFYAGFCRRVESLRRYAQRYGNAKIFLRARGTNAKRISES